jgi:hypothetical protein
VTKLSGSVAAIVAGRILLVTVAAAAVVVGVVASRRSPPAATTATPAYVCPMHPEVTSSLPGDCPICRMALEPAANVARGTEPMALKLDKVHRELRAFDAVSLVKRFETSQEMRAPAWAETANAGLALFFRDQAKILLPGEAGVFEPAGRPGEPPPAGIVVRIEDAAPEPWDAATVRVRFRADKTDRLPPGATGAVKFDTRLRRGLVIKASAVLPSPDGPYVLVATDERRTLTKRPVEVGSIIQGYVGVEGGLREGEWVVAKNAFALDAARKMGWRRTP